MKKTLILAMALTLALAGSLFAQGTFTPGASIGGFGVTTTGPSTINNDDTCDISTAPAATLLLPYFEVNTTNRNTIFTLVNTSPASQIAHVTVWTDWSFPVLDFNVYLTGYDVQGISLRDVIFNAVIAPETAGPGTAGTTDTGDARSPYGPESNLPFDEDDGGEGSNPNFLAEIGCTNLPGSYSPALALAVQNALINGVYNSTGFPFCEDDEPVGSDDDDYEFHPEDTAVGYVTVDVAADCTLALPTDPDYYEESILFDNVLTGDYETFDTSAASNYAGGTPLVHIRAIPEGGPAGADPAPGTAYTNLPYTFYSRYLSGNAGLDRVRDRRQPLPAQWAARFTDGTGLNTSFKIWREGVTGPVATDATGCDTSDNEALSIAEVLRFDEHENVQGFGAPSGDVSPTPPTPPGVATPEAVRIPVGSGFFPDPPEETDDAGGWMFMNLDFDADEDQNPSGVDPDALPSVPGVLPASSTTNNPLYPNSAYPGGRPAQSWVTVSMSGTGAAAGALAVDFDATWLANGCTAARDESDPIGPAVDNDGILDNIGAGDNVNP